MSEYKQIPEWKKKILAKKGRNKRDRTKILRNQHKKPQILLEKEVTVAKIVKDREKIVVKPIKNPNIEKFVNRKMDIRVSKLVSHYELLIKSRKNKLKN